MFIDYLDQPKLTLSLEDCLSVLKAEKIWRFIEFSDHYIQLVITFLPISSTNERLALGL